MPDLLNQIASLPAATIASLTGLSNPTDIEKVRADFYAWAERNGEEFGLERWETAWTLYRRSQDADADSAIELESHSSQTALSPHDLNTVFWNLIENEDYESAIRVCREAIKISPNNAEARYNLGLALHDFGDYDNAIRELQKSVQLNPDDDYAYRYLGQSLKKKGDYKEAISVYQQASRISSDDEVLDFISFELVVIGRSLEEIGDYDSAIRAYREAIRIRKAIRIEADQVYIYIALGKAILSKGDSDSAIRAFQKAIQIDPNRDTPHYGLGVALKDIGEYDNAIEELHTSIRLSNNEENKQQARRIINEIEEITGSSSNDFYQNCPICERECSYGPALSNGKVYHPKCHDDVLKRVEQFQEQIDNLRQEKQRLKEQVDEAESFAGSLKRFFVGGESEVPNLRKRIAELEHEIGKLDQEREHFSSVLKRLYDYWPTYPPDWESRRKEVLGVFPFCQTSRRHRGPFHVHHEIPLSQGGSNLPENLTTLCEKCHSERHGGRDFRYENSTESSAYARNLAVLKEAIKINGIVHFSYRKYSGVESVRSIRPIRFEQVGKSLCVSGYCYLRQDNRTFAIKRIRDSMLVGTPGRGYDK